MVLYGQAVVGPPGSGKTTYCNGMQQYLKLLGRDAHVINLDPANEFSGGEHDGTALPYECLWNVCDHVVTSSSVMTETGLGPNGGLVYCMEYIEAHIDDVIAALQQATRTQTQTTTTTSSSTTTTNCYLILDLPGQVELYTHSTCVQNILHKLTKALDLRLTAVQLIDSLYCTDVSKFVSAALLGTTTMLRLELPTVNVLSKMDLLAGYGSVLPMQLDYFTECHDLQRLLPFLDNSLTQQQHDVDDDRIDDLLDDPDYHHARMRRKQSTFYKKYSKLHAALAEVVDDFGLLSFSPLDITQSESVARVLARIDKANGFVFTSKSVPQDLFQCAIQADNQYEALADVKERILDESVEKRRIK